jgi:hypothetical protein
MSQRSDADFGRLADDHYLPGGPVPSTAPGPVERVLTRLFRRRGRF